MYGLNIATEMTRAYLHADLVDGILPMPSRNAGGDIIGVPTSAADKYARAEPPKEAVSSNRRRRAQP